MSNNIQKKPQSNTQNNTQGRSPFDTFRKATNRNMKATLALYANIAVAHVENLSGINSLKDRLGNNNSTLTIEEARTLYANFYFIEKLLEQVEFEANKNAKEKFVEAEAIEQQQADEITRWMKLLNALRNSVSHGHHVDISIDKNNRTICDLLERLYLEAVSHSKNNIPDKYRTEQALYSATQTKDQAQKVAPNKRDHTDRTVHPNQTTEQANVIRKAEATEQAEATGATEQTLRFSTTGKVFLLSLFLHKDDVSDFVEALEIDHLTDKAQKDRETLKPYAKQGIPYPEELRPRYKLMLYARDVYTYWANRGHRSYLTLADTFVEKEKCFSILEYLKRIPSERLASKVTDYTLMEREGSEGDERLHQRAELIIDQQSHVFDVREKNKFMEWTLDYWESECATLFKAESPQTEKISIRWQWARHRSAEEKKQLKAGKKRAVNPQGRVSEKIQRLCRHEKVIWGVPEEDDFNDRNDVVSFPYYFEADQQGQYSQALFKCSMKKGTQEEQTFIGLMGRKLLSNILERYLANFPIDKPGEEKERRDFFINLTKGCFNYVDRIYPERSQKSPRTTVTKQQLEKRIKFLKEKYAKEGETTNTHERILFVADTWNQMLSCGMRNNRTHALDEKGYIGGKSGYQEILKALSALAPAPIPSSSATEDGRNGNSDEKEELYQFLEQRRDAKHQDLINLLKTLGIGGRDHKGRCYLEVLNEALKFGKQKQIADLTVKKIQGQKTLLDLFEQCKVYRKETLDFYDNIIKQEPFNPATQWRPHIEMRWLGLRDGRTPEVANYRPNAPKEQSTGILNIDRHQHTAIGMPAKMSDLFIGLTKEAEANKRFRERPFLGQRPSPGSESPASEDNGLLITSFYKPENPEVWAGLTWSQKYRLNEIYREDLVLAHLAYAYGKKAQCELSGMMLSDQAFQNQQLNIAVTSSPKEEPSAYVSFYYRHYKQNHYRLPKQMTTALIDLMIERGLIEKGAILPYNNLEPINKSDLSDDDKRRFFWEESYRNLPMDQILQRINEKIAVSKDPIFVPKAEATYFMSELLDSYNICRKVFIKDVLEMEYRIIKRYDLQPEEENGKKKNYISFSQITRALVEHEVLDPTEGEDLKELRNSASHNKMPKSKWVPMTKEELIKKNKDGKTYLEIFGMGFALIGKVNTQIKGDRN
ncbi:MAG: hypothetical protein ACK5ND_01580 [Bacteroides sp.]